MANNNNKNPPRPSRLTALPNEILNLILPNLDAPSAVCLALTCRRCYSYVRSATHARTLDDICPKDYYKQTTTITSLQLYGVAPFYDNSKLPHYRNPFKISGYASEFGISLRLFNPPYVQLLLCLREFMAPGFVFCL